MDARTGWRINWYFVAPVCAVMIMLVASRSMTCVRRGDALRSETKYRMGTIEHAVRMYHEEYGVYPTDLHELIVPTCEELPPFLDGGEKAICDAWGQPMRFEITPVPGGKDRITVRTTSPDGERIEWPRR